MNADRIQELRELINHDSDGPVLSVFCRTDPRDPANNSETPAWSIALKNGLKEITASLNGDHGESETVKKLCAEAERRLVSASAAQRGRSIAFFVGGSGTIDSMTTFQIPVRDNRVAIDAGPVIWPMLDVIERGARTGLVLLSHDHIRLLEWADGIARDLEESTFDLELGDWHQYRGPARPQGISGGHGVSHVASYDDRVKEWRARFVKAAAKAIADSATDLGFERLVVAAEGDLGKEFESAIPDSLRQRIACIVPTNLIDMTAADAAAHLDPHLREAWKKSACEVADEALERVQAAGRGAGGADEVLLALGEGRVEHLVFDPYLETEDESLSDAARQAIADAGESSVQEALAELALRTDARISSASIEEVPALAESGGVLALLRY